MVLEISTQSIELSGLLNSLGVAAVGAAVGTAVGAIMTGRTIRSEAKQKIKQDSIVGIIDRIGELKLTINRLTFLMMDTVWDILGQMSQNYNFNAQNNSQTKNIVEIGKSKFFEYSIVQNEEINKFIFLIIKDMMLNNEINGEYNLIRDDIQEIKNIRKEIVISIEEIYTTVTKNKTTNNILKEFEKRKEDIDTKNSDFLNKLMVMYTNKLNENPENWFCKLFNYFINCFCKCCRKLLDCPRKVKIIRMKKRKRSRLQDEP